MIKQILLFIAFIIIISLPTAGKAQNIGFLGKHLSIFYNLNQHPQVFNDYAGNYFNSQNYDEHSFFRRHFKFTHRIEVDYTLARNFSMGIFGNYTRSGVGKSNYTLNNFGGNYTATSTGLSLKFFSYKKGAIAPLGTYTGIRFFRTSLNSFDTGREDIYGKDHIINEENQSFYNVSLVFGKQQVLYKKILLNVGVELALALTKDKNTSNNGTTKSESYDDFFGRQFASFTFGIGLCPI